MKSKKNFELEPYSTDASMIPGQATQVVFPKTIGDIKEALSFGKITIRGGGTGLVGGAVPQNSLVLDMSKMNKVIEFNMDKRNILVEAGMLLDELNSEVERYGLEFPVKPSSHSVCTIGGMIATNAVGNRAIKYGKTLDWVEELEVVDGNGELLKIGKVELGDFVGMEGTTGVIVKAKLKLSPRKERTASLFKLKNFDEVLEAVQKLKMEKDVSAIELFDKFSSNLLGFGENYSLIAEFESERGSLKHEEYDKLMNLRDDIYPLLAKQGYVHIQDPKLLIHKTKELAEYLVSENVPFFGHIGVGIIHPVFKAGEEDKIKRMLNYVKRLHGQVSGEHGIGILKREFLDFTEKKLIMSIKRRRDPFCKLNCGNMVDEAPEISKRGRERVEQVQNIIDEQNKASEETI